MRSQSKPALWLVATSVLLGAGCGGGGEGTTIPLLPVSTQGVALAPSPAIALELGGAVDQPVTYSQAALSARQSTTQSVSFTSGSGAQTHTYIGTSLWALLNEAGIQSDPIHKNDALSRYVQATGADGYRAIFTLGELSPDFGNKPSVVAYAEVLGGTSMPLSTADGPFRLTAPGDVKGGRYVSNLVRLDVVAPPVTASSTGGGVSPSFTVSGHVNTSMSFDLPALQAMATSTQTVGANIYTGVSLWALLNKLGLRLPASIKNPTLTMYVVATGSDGYRAAVSLAEMDPGFGNKAALIAYEMNHAALGGYGMARLVLPGDVKQGRSVSNLIALEVFTANPISP